MKVWIFIAICLVSGAIGLIVVGILYGRRSKSQYNYGIGIDAGSSRTDFYVYRWPTEKLNGTGVVEQIYKCPSASDSKIPAITNIDDTLPRDVGNRTVRTCLDKILNVIPSTEYCSTPVLLGATAGMRLFNLSDPASAQEVMKSLRVSISSYPFLFTQPERQVRIIDGSEEGAFGWVTSNYLSGSYGVQPSQPVSPRTSSVGALDMGGASTQITFSPGFDQSLAQSGTFLRLFGYSYNIYAHSYLCYGMDEANRKYKALLVKMQNYSATVDDPCAPAGSLTPNPKTTIFKEPCTSPANLPAGIPDSFLLRGTGNSTLCHSLTRMIFNTSVPCPKAPCTFDGVYQPPLSGDFYAFSGYYFLVSDLGLNPPGNFTLSDYRRAMDNNCARPWNETLAMQKSKSPDILVVLCFQAHHIYHFLVDFFGFNDANWNSVKFVSQINNNNFGWALGMMVNATNALQPAACTPTTDNSVFIILLVVFAFLVFVAIVLALGALVWRRSVRDDSHSSHL